MAPRPLLTTLCLPLMSRFSELRRSGPPRPGHSARSPCRLASGRPSPVARSACMAPQPPSPSTRLTQPPSPSLHGGFLSFRAQMAGFSHFSFCGKHFRRLLGSQEASHGQGPSRPTSAVSSVIPPSVGTWCRDELNGAGGPALAFLAEGRVFTVCSAPEVKSRGVTGCARPPGAA